MALLAVLHTLGERGRWRWCLSGHRGTRTRDGASLTGDLGQDLGGEFRLKFSELVRVQPEGFPRPLAGRQGAYGIHDTGGHVLMPGIGQGI
jgi:hypothetical protein